MIWYVQTRRVTGAESSFLNGLNSFAVGESSLSILGLRISAGFFFSQLAFRRIAEPYPKRSANSS